MRKEVRKTGDHSPTLFVPELKEHYHSLNGAASESLHVFISNGLDFLKQNKDLISILEVGMGTGLNVCLASQHAGECEITYTAIEPFPLDASVWKELNYIEWVDPKMFSAVHESMWNSSIRMSGSNEITFKKVKATIQDFQSEEKFDLIFFDAFAPDVQPELWTGEVFEKLFQLTLHGGALVTYCAKGSVKRALRSSGFIVESLPGAPGKREMVRAIK